MSRHHRAATDITGDMPDEVWLDMRSQEEVWDNGACKPLALSFYASDTGDDIREQDRRRYVCEDLYRKTLEQMHYLQRRLREIEMEMKA